MDQGNRIDSRARGNATQMLEKYKKMAHDAQMNGDRVATEYYLQFADHYFRVLADNRARQDEYRRPREDQVRDGNDFADDEDDGIYGSGQGQRNYAQEQADDANARGQDDDGADDGDEPRNPRRDHQQRDGRQNNERRERRPRGDREEGRREDSQRPERQPRQHQDTDERQDETAIPVEAAEASDEDAKPRRTLRGRGRPPRAADAEASNALDPMILPPAIGVATEAPAEAEAPKPKRRAAPRRKAAESGDMEAAAAE